MSVLVAVSAGPEGAADPATGAAEADRLGTDLGSVSQRLLLDSPVPVPAVTPEGTA